jgi:hypothetical protein
MGENSERRVSPRHPCTGAADILQNGKLWGWGKVSDISHRGCYIETDNTLPVGTEAQLRLTIAGNLLEIVGKVASATPVVGMGIDFVIVTPEQENKLARIIEKVTGASRSSGVQQDEPAQPSVATVRIRREAAPDILAKVIRRINERGVLTRQELVDIVKANQ